MNEIQTFAGFVAGFFCGWEILRRRTKNWTTQCQETFEDGQKTIAKFLEEFEREKAKVRKVVELERQANDLMISTSDAQVKAHERAARDWRLQVEMQANEYY